MAHKEQWVFCGKVKGLHSEFFENKKVLDIGSFDVNGNEEFLFKNCDFTGLDIGEGDGVDVVVDTFVVVVAYFASYYLYY